MCRFPNRIGNIQPITIGHTMDGGCDLVEIDCNGWINQYPQLKEWRIEVTNPDGLIYFAENVALGEDGVLRWPISQADTAVAGEGKYQVVAIGTDGQQKTSNHRSVTIHQTMPGTAQETPPDPAKPWTNEVLEAAKRAEASAKRAEDACTMGPIIGDNGNWYVWNAEQDTYVDTGVLARGTDGKQGPQGTPGKDAEPYTLPKATAYTLGGVKVGSGLSYMQDGTLSTVLPLTLVRYDMEQGLSDANKSRARSNIGAASVEDAVRLAAMNAGYLQGGAFSQLATYTQYTIREYVNPTIIEVSGGAFSGIGENLEYVDLPNCKKINGGGFSGAIKLAKVNFPKVEEIGGGAFGGCIFESIVLPCVKVLQSGALFNPNNLRFVDIGQVCEIGSGALSCIGLETLILRSKDGVCTINEYAFNSGANFYIYVPAILKAQYETTYKDTTFADRFRAIEDYPDIVPTTKTDTDGGGGTITGVVRYDREMALTEEQKAQARANIGADGVHFTTDETLSLDPETGVLSVNTTDQVEADNTLPVTAAAVQTTVGNINALLETI